VEIFREILIVNLNPHYVIFSENEISDMQESHLQMKQQLMAKFEATKQMEIHNQQLRIKQKEHQTEIGKKGD